MIPAGPYIIVVAAYPSVLLCQPMVGILLPEKTYYRLLDNPLHAELAATVYTAADVPGAVVCADVAFQPQGMSELRRAEVYTPPWLGDALVAGYCLDRLLKGPPVSPPPIILPPVVRARHALLMHCLSPVKDGVGTTPTAILLSRPPSG